MIQKRRLPFQNKGGFVMKKALSLFLALLMLLSAATALAEELPIVPEKIEVKIAVWRHQNDASASFDEKAFVKKAEEDTNIHVNWIEIVSDGDTKLAAMLAGDMPDAFIGPMSDKIVVSNTGLFADLTDKVETLVPNFVKLCEENDIDWKTFLTYPDGHIYSIMGGYWSNPSSETNGVNWINTAWLKELGLEMPSTAEELHTVLAAVKKAKPDSIPLDFCQSHYAAEFWNLTSMWGIPGFVLLKDGKAYPTVNTDAFYDALTTLHAWMEEGLINPEGFTQTDSQYNSNLDSMKVCLFCGWGPWSYIKDSDNREQYEVMAPVAAEGYTAVWPTKSQSTAIRNNLVINAQSPYVDEILKWWNYLSDGQGMALFIRNGEEGLTYYLDENGEYQSRNATEEDYIKFGYEQYANNVGSSTVAASLGLVNYHPLMIEALPAQPGSNAMIRRLAVNATKPFFSDYVPNNFIPAEAQEEFSFATEGLTDFIKNFAATSIVNGLTRADFDAFVSQLNNYGYDYYVAYYQKRLDNSF